MNSSFWLLLFFPLQAFGENPLKRSEDDSRRGPVLPFYASIFIDDAWFCSGIFISDKLVLTTAHCVDGGSYFDISLGGEPDGQLFSSTDAVIHPNYDPATFSSDLAVIRLSEAAQVDPATLPAPGEVLQVGDLVCMDNLDQTFVCAPVMTNEDCNAVFGNVPEDIVCLDQSMGQLCGVSRTSGAPGVLGEDGGHWTLVGVMEFGSSEGCAAGLPVALARMEYHIDWINGLSVAQ